MMEDGWILDDFFAALKELDSAEKEKEEKSKDDDLQY